MGLLYVLIFLRVFRKRELEFASLWYLQAMLMMRRKVAKELLNLPYIRRASWGLNPKGGGTVTPVTHQPHTAASDLMWVQPHHTGVNGQTDCGRPTPGMDC